MNENITMPKELTDSIGSETQDFVVKADRLMPARATRQFTIFGTFWMTISSIIGGVMFVPVLMGKDVHFESGGVDVVAGPGNLGPLIVPGIAISVFLIIGISIIAYTIHGKFTSGGFFVGTATRLINYRNKHLRSIDWENFNGDIEAYGDNQNGDLSLTMRTGRVVKKKGRSERFVPDIIDMAGIQNNFAVAEMCRKRIKENDPTITQP